MLLDTTYLATCWDSALVEPAGWTDCAAFSNKLRLHVGHECRLSSHERKQELVVQAKVNTKPNNKTDGTKYA